MANSPAKLRVPTMDHPSREDERWVVERYGMMGDWLNLSGTMPVRMSLDQAILEVVRFREWQKEIAIHAPASYTACQSVRIRHWDTNEVIPGDILE